MRTSDDCDHIQIRDISESRRFFREDLGFTETQIGDDTWKFNLGGNCIVCRLSPQLGRRGKVAHSYSFMPDRASLVPHCRVALSLPDWIALVARLHLLRLKLLKDREKCIVLDPSGNAVEFRVINNDDVLAPQWWRRGASAQWLGAICAVILLSAWLLLS